MYPEKIVKALQRAQASLRAGNPAAALDDLAKVVQKTPNGFEGWLMLGQANGMLNNHAQAGQCFKKATEINPQSADAWHNLGLSLAFRGMYQQALPAYSRAVSVSGNPHPNILTNMGSCLLQLDQYEEAVKIFTQVIGLIDSSDAWTFLGMSYQGLDRYQDALSAYLKAFERGGTGYALNLNIGTCYNMLHDYAHAVEYAERALQFKTDDYVALYNMGGALKELARFDEAAASYRRVLKIKPDFAEAHSNLLLSLNYVSSVTPAAYLAEAQKYGARVAAKVSDRFTTWQCESNPKRLRVGMVSGDLREHSVGHFVEGLLAHIDPARIELIAYPTHSREDALTLRIKPYFSAWKPLSGLGDQAAAQLIHADGVQVLMDLSGHSADNRLPVFAWKPAPVQALWLGYFASTGLAEMDYVLGDKWTLPEAEAHHFVEKGWCLPDVLWCMAPPREAPAIDALPALRNQAITFGTLNNLTKMNDRVIACWARILNAVPRSRLYLNTKSLRDEQVKKNIIGRYAAHGVDESRLILDATAGRAAALNSYNMMDIALDPFPYPGGTTSYEALWMGVPVLTLRGNSYVSHLGESILHNAGLPDWVAEDEDDYVARAVLHSENRERLATLRAGLRQQVLASPLYDAPRFARNFEDALWGMWHKWVGK